MSEPIPEAIPTSADPRSRRPVKRIRTGNANTALAAQADEIEDLMWDPSRPVNLPLSTTERKAKSSLPAPPEIVANVQGSSAGAGSGEFHVYKASRRREYERLRTMDEEAKQEEDEKKWGEEERSRRDKDEEKTRKNREKRNRRKKGGKLEGGGPSGATKADNSSGTPGDKQIEKGASKKALDVPRRIPEGSADQGSDVAVAELAKENGIIIHDDD